MRHKYRRNLMPLHFRRFCGNITMFDFTVVILVFGFVQNVWLCDDVIRHMERPITIGAITDGPMTQPYPVASSHDCNVSILWHNIDMQELFYIFRSVRLLDDQHHLDLIVIFDYHPLVIRGTPVLATHNYPLVTWGKKREESDSQMAQYIRESEVVCNRCDQSTENAEEGFFCQRYPTKLMPIKRTLITEDNAMAVLPGVIAEIAKRQKWKTVVVLHDYLYDHVINPIQDRISESRILMMLYDLDVVTDAHAMLRQVYTTTHTTEKQINFVVICGFDCLFKILKTANLFDHRNFENKTLLKHISRWLIVVPDYTHMKSALLQTIADDLDNVAVLTVPEIDLPSKQEFPLIVESIIKEIYKEREESIDDSEEITNYLVSHLPDKLNSWHPASKCQGYFIESLLMTKEGRRFGTVGHYDRDGVVHLSSNLYPNTNYGYGRRQFTVATLPYPPFVIKREENGTYVYEGSFMELLWELSRVLNFTYKLVEPEDGKWGSFVIEENYTFNGLVGMLQKKEADFVVTPLSIQAEREKVVDFAYTVYHDFTTVLMRKPDANAKKWKTLLSPLKWEVLVSIGISLTFASFIIYTIENYGAFYLIEKHDKRRRLKPGGLNYKLGAFWFIYGALLCQGSIHLPKSTSGRIFVSSWCIFCIMIVGIYSGNLIAFLTVTKTQAPFNSLEEMVKLKDSMKWGTLGGTFWVVTLETSIVPIFQEVGDLMFDFYKEDPSILDVNTDYHIDRVKQGGYAWIGDISTMEVYMSKECDLMTIKEEFWPMRYAFAFQENSPLTSTFSDAIINILEGGLMEMWKRKWWPKADFCSTENVAEAKPITLADVQSAFYICAIGAFSGTVAFMCELIVYCVRKRKHSETTITRTETASTIVA